MAVIALLALGAGAAGGYLLYPLIHGVPAGAAELASRDTVACTLSPEQMDRLAASIAPAVVRRFTESGLPRPPADPATGAALAQEEGERRSDQAAAYSRAAELVDQMIETRAVTPQGRARAEALLSRSGQADRIPELSARISAAINRGELTLEEAGQVPPALP